MTVWCNRFESLERQLLAQICATVNRKSKQGYQIARARVNISAVVLHNLLIIIRVLDRILLPMEEIEMSYSEDELGEREAEAEEPTDEEAIYSPERQVLAFI